MDWKTYLHILDLPNIKSIFRLNLPATDSQLKDLQEHFQLNELPGELLELYKQTDGIEEYLDNNKIGELIWPIKRVIETNKDFRSHPHFKDLYMSFEQLLFFADAGNGDLFGFITLEGDFDREDIFVWNHENDSRVWVSPSLNKFIEWWLNGTIKV